MSVDVPKALRRRAKSAPSTCQKQTKQKNCKACSQWPSTCQKRPLSRRAKNRKTEKLYKASPNVRRRAKSAPSTCQKQKNRKTVRLVPMSVDVPTVLLRKTEDRKTVRHGPMCPSTCQKRPFDVPKTEKQKNCKAGPNVRRRAKIAPSTSRKRENRKTVRLVPMSVDVPKAPLRRAKNRKTEKL